MEARFWQLGHLSDQQLLARLQGVLPVQRRALAELIAHLGEVEERRLHLRAAYGSLFSYCVERLGMSEDEACRRIEVARLARRFPVLFAELASGSITLSVALLLKRVLSPDNHLELIAAVRGASSRRASEILAARFPSPDVPSRIRKLPERQRAAVLPVPTPTTAARSVAAVPSVTAPAPATASTASASASATVIAPYGSCERPSNKVVLSPQLSAPQLSAPQLSAPQLSAPQPCPSPRFGPRQGTEPISAGRYRVQFTADAGLKRKLEQARDLLRHAEPSGDFGAIVSRALDSLLDELMGRRSGARRKERVAQRAAAVTTEASSSGATSALAAAGVAVAPAVVTGARSTAAQPRATLGGEPRATSHLVRAAARRAVLARDGLGCSWVDAEGRRCGSTAWLEIDHRHPVARGGSAEPDNLRLLCRAHNQFAAECAYGRPHIERAMRARRTPVERAPAAPRVAG